MLDSQIVPEQECYEVRTKGGWIIGSIASLCGKAQSMLQKEDIIKGKYCK
jgi:hypothetical protein